VPDFRKGEQVIGLRIVIGVRQYLIGVDGFFEDGAGVAWFVLVAVKGTVVIDRGKVRRIEPCRIEIGYWNDEG